MSAKEEQPLVCSAIRRPLRTALSRSARLAGLATCLLGLGSAWAPATFADAAPGDLDASFGGDGRVVTDFGAIDFANGVAVRPDGRIVAAGGRITMGASDFALARYTADGTLDPSFAGNGTIRTNHQAIGDRRRDGSDDPRQTTRDRAGEGQRDRAGGHLLVGLDL
ncbi:MAG: delta-60 repeat domain-containing protein [Solirubrobacterales bacterium]